MKAPRLARTFLWTLAALALLAAFVLLDWYPTVKNLGRLRRERSDLERKIIDYEITAAGFAFPDQDERRLFADSRDRLLQELAWIEDEAAWLRRCTETLRLQAEKDKLAGAQLWVSSAPDGELEPAIRLAGQGPTDAWLAAQLPAIRKSMRAAAEGDFPWKSLFSDPATPLTGQLACRPLAVVLAAPLPALLRFVNHCSWGMRLEIVRLRVLPGAPLFPQRGPWPVGPLAPHGGPRSVDPLVPHGGPRSVDPLARAWLVCRSSFQTRAPSPWGVPLEPAGAGGELLVDPDSPLLWQRVEPRLPCRAEKKELPPARGGIRE